jgi:hypothetical protein
MPSSLTPIQAEPEIDLQKLVPLRELLKEIPAALAGTPLTMASARRWVKQGVRARDGSAIRLRATKAPRCWLSSRAALIEFLAAQTADALSPHVPPARRLKADATA